jgi:hypothetical protein
MLLARLRHESRRGLLAAFGGRARANLARKAAEAPALDLAPFAPFFSPGRAGKGRARELDLEKGRLSLLGREVELAPAGVWTDPGLPLLARYKLHGLGYLELVAGAAPAPPKRRLRRREGAHEGRRAEAFRFFRDLVSGWIETNPFPAAVAWDPYPTSLRAVNLLKCAAAFGDELGSDRSLAETLARSLYAHGLHLERSVEWHLRLNHLVENARALLLLGRAFRDRRARRWGGLARRILDEAVREQFFPDGCHVERAPMYHMIVLEDLLDCVELVVSEGGRPEGTWLGALSAAAGFARAILHPDGEIPLVNDSCLGEARASREIISRAEAVLGGVPETVPAESDFRVVRAKDLFLFVDGGEPSPSYNPAHSHAGALSYELSLLGERAVADTGVGGYDPGEERRYCRSTPAHNTVSVAGRDQSEVWASFRVGGRARSSVSPVTAEGRRLRITGSCRHWRGGTAHSREWVVWPGRGVLVLDSVSGAPDGPVRSFVRSAPGWKARRRGERAWAFERGRSSFYLAALAPWECAESTCRVWTGFGRAHEVPLVVLESRGDVPLAGYFLGIGPVKEADLRPRERTLVLDGVRLEW